VNRYRESATHSGCQRGLQMTSSSEKRQQQAADTWPWYTACLVDCLSYSPTISNTVTNTHTRLSDEVPQWLSVWSKVQMICLWSSWCHCHPVISWFIKVQNGSASCHSIFYRPDALPAAQPTASKHWRHSLVVSNEWISRHVGIGQPLMQLGVFTPWKICLLQCSL